MAALPLLVLDGLKAVWGWLTGLPWQVWAGLALCVALWGFGHWRYNAGQDEVQTRWDAAEVAHKALYDEMAAQARVDEARWRADYDAAVSRLTKENDDAAAEHDRVVAGLRAGTVRLRSRFRCPTGGVPGAPGTAGGGDAAGGAGFDEADAAVALGIARDGDAAIRQLTACQSLLRSTGE